tara:strand:+ start:304 stop:1311 length:1008 start_codon:yes stop_codon:yes gene_type:complete
MKDYLKYKLSLVFYLLLIFTIPVKAQFAPAVGVQGTTAIHKDSSIFVNWATNCSVNIGPEDISNSQSILASAGDSSMAIGSPGNGIVSLGDAGDAILSFDRFIENGHGWDFAIFENAFSDTFLELGFVEVSSNGTDFYRFPATSLTQDTFQIDAFGSVNPSEINNLAGKYRANYGTPFDLEELINEPNLDVNSISHVKIIDVVGSIDSIYCNYDQYLNKINDPFPTPFPSSGFDLDAVGVIYQAPVNILEENYSSVLKDFRIINGVILFDYENKHSVSLSTRIFDLTGKIISQKNHLYDPGTTQNIDIQSFKNGVYILNISTKNKSINQKFFLKN